MEKIINSITDDGYEMFKNGKDELQTQFGAGMLYAMSILKKEINIGVDISEEVIQINNRINTQKEFTEHYPEMHTTCHMDVSKDKIELLCEKFNSEMQKDSGGNEYFSHRTNMKIITFITGV